MKWKTIKEQIKQEIKLLTYSLTGALLTFTIFLMIMTVFANYGFVETVLYEMKEERIQDDVFIKLVADRCSFEKDDFIKVYCVYNIVSAFYRYEYRNSTSDFIMPSTLMVEGGICRDAAILYCSIFSQLDIKCKYEFVENHVFNVLDLDNGYCILDQTKLECD